MRKILLVEDENILRETYSILLSTQPYLLDVAENGQVALEKCQQKTYDLILLDLMMPVLDGIGFLKSFKADPANTTRVVILSNLSSGKEIDEALHLGAERNLLKATLTPTQLLSIIRYELEATIV